MNKQLATINNARAGQAFIDYMALQGIAVQMQHMPDMRKTHRDQPIELWVDDSDYVTAIAAFNAFIQQPNDPKYLAASWQQGDSRHSLQHTSGGPNSLDYPSLRQGFSALASTWFSRSGWLVTGVALLSVVIFGLLHVTNLFNWLTYGLADGSQSGQWWRYLTPVVIHFSVMHIAFNLVAWWVFGGMVERYIGWSFLLLFSVVVGVLSNMGQFMIADNPYFGGLSGIVYGLIGFCWLYGVGVKNSPITVSNSLFGFALVWMVLGYADLLWVTMANGAHTGGLLVGMIFAIPFRFGPGTGHRSNNDH